jgi:ligand-binding sensor domain-containing protein
MNRVLLLFVFFISVHQSFSIGGWTTYKIEDGYSPKNDIWSICFGKQGDMWAGTSYGIYKNETGKWIAQNVENIYVQTLFIDKKNTKWAGLYGGGVYKCEAGKNWRTVKDASPTNTVNVITSDHEGNIWLGGWGGCDGNLDEKGQIDVRNKTGGAINYNGKEWVSFKADQVNLGDNSVTSIVCDAKNRIWFGTYHGLSMLKNGIWTLYNKQNSALPDNDVYSLASDRAGNVWIGTCNGLVKIAGTKWTVYNNENSGLTYDLILSLATGANGSVWVGTNKGVFLFDGSKWMNYNVKNSGLIDNRVQTIVVYKNKVYFGTSNGISVYEQ